MNLIVHLLTGATLGAAISTDSTSKPAMMWLGAIAAAAPDLDHLIERLARRYGSDAASSLRSRALLHSLVALPLLAFFGMVLVQGLAPLLGIAFGGPLLTAALIAAAIAAHIALDLVSEDGVRLLHPYSNQHWSTSTHSRLDPVILALLLSVFFGVLPLTVLASLFAYVSAMLAWREMLHLRAQRSIRIAGWPGAEVHITPGFLSPLRWKVTAHVNEALIMTSMISLPGHHPIVWRPLIQDTLPRPPRLPATTTYKPFMHRMTDADADKPTGPCRHGAGMHG